MPHTEAVTTQSDFLAWAMALGAMLITPAGWA